MVDRNKSPGEGSADDSFLTRRTVLRATAATGTIPFIGYGAGASPSSAGTGAQPSLARTESVQDVMFSNWTDRHRSLELVLDVDATADGGDVTSGRTTVEIAPNASSEIQTLTERFDASVQQSFADAGSATLSVTDGGAASDSVAIDAGLSSSNEIVDVVLYSDEVRVMFAHFDAIGPTGGDA